MLTLLEDPSSRILKENFQKKTLFVYKIKNPNPRKSELHKTESIMTMLPPVRPMHQMIFRNLLTKNW